MSEPVLRFRDLKARRLVDSHAQLKHLQDNGCFPLGAWIGPNTRIFTKAEIDAHLLALQLVELRKDADEIAKATGFEVAKAQAYIDMVSQWREARRSVNKGHNRRASLEQRTTGAA